MAPLPSNSTGVFFLDYTTEGRQHTLQIRFGTGSSALEAAGVAEAFLTALGTNMYVMTVDGARVRDAGGSVTYPVTWGGPATFGSGTEGLYATAQYVNFVGRSIGGRRCRLAVFGWKGIVDTGDDNFRFSSAVGWVAAALAALEALPECPVSVDGDVVNWQQYANTGINAYWRNHIR